MMDNQEEVLKPNLIKKNKLTSDLFEPTFKREMLWVKLKFPKDEGNLGNYEDQPPYMNQMKKCSNDVKRACQICNKVFNSGKALGGHMRFHVQQANKNMALKKKLNHLSKKRNPRDESDERWIELVKKKHGNNVIMKNPICAICGKDFISMNSLFGHMRCHPERDWRGIQPPQSKTSFSSIYSSLSDSDEILDSDEKSSPVDLTESLWGWKVTAKRGRGSLKEDDELRSAVNELMLLAHGNSSPHGRKVGESEGSSSVLGIDPFFNKKKKRKIYSPVEQPGDEDRGSNEVEETGVGSGLIPEESVNDTKLLIKNKKKRKKVKLCDLDLSQTAAKRREIQNQHSNLITERSKLSGDEGNNRCKRVLDFDLNEMPTLEGEPHLISMNLISVGNCT